MMHLPHLARRRLDLTLTTALKPVLAAHEMNEMLIASWRETWTQLREGVAMSEPGKCLPFVDFGEQL